MTFSRVTAEDIAPDLSEELETGEWRTAMAVNGQQRWEWTGVCPNHAGRWGGGGRVESGWEEPLLWDQRSKSFTLESFRGRLCLTKSEIVSQEPLCQPLKSGQQDTTEELEGASKSRNVEMNVRRMGRKETNKADFSIVPLLPATRIEKERKRRGNLLQRRVKKLTILYRFPGLS